jgi:iron complex outermembrane recepter protein
MITRSFLSFTIATGLALLSPLMVQQQQARAQQQEAGQGQSLGEVIVTARKRQESILNVPVVETVLQPDQMQRFQTQDLKDIATMVPGLVVGDSVLSNGTQISLRGVGTSSYDPGIDQSVSLNIDGLQVSQGLAYGSAMFDMDQVEVLEGPQSLFYGKSSPGGVISIRTADPTDQFELIGRGGYEFEASEKRGEFIISGPVAPGLKVRIASYYDSQDGFYDNIATGLAALGGETPVDKHITPATGYMVRGTVLWDPSSQFSARLKVNRVNDRTLYAGSAQLVSCPSGTGPVFNIPAINPNENCQLDRNLGIVDMAPSAFVGIANSGVPYQTNDQTYGSLELNYLPTSSLTLTSTTGYYLIHSSSLVNTDMSSYAAPLLAAENGFDRHEVTEELRVNSDFNGPFNFTVGGLLERAQFSDLVSYLGNLDLGAPPVVGQGITTVDIKTNSLFAQVRYKILPDFEAALGARWTDENRPEYATDLSTGVPISVPLAVSNIHSSNVSPELTLTYRPTSDLTVFGALKKGYKSGSYNVGAPPTPNENNAFGDEMVKGGEIGVKSRWFERRLALDVSAYDYHYFGLQVGAIEPVSNGVPVQSTINAGSAVVYGLETNATYLPPQIDDLKLHAGINWNHARFLNLNNVPCYGGQTIAAGCNEDYSVASGGYTAQNQSGLPLIRAPNVAANFGFDYSHELNQDLTFSFGSSTQFSSKYLTDLGIAYYQKAFFKTDVSATLQDAKDRWEVSLVGKNLNDALTTGNCANANVRGSLLPGSEITGTNLVGPAGTDDIVCWMDRGREVWLRLTIKPFNHRSD